MKTSFTKEINKESVFNQIEKGLLDGGFNIISRDSTRPWGGFFVIDDHQSEKFIQTFFKNVKVEEVSGVKKISPKILIVESGKKLSWQYHFRRAELWKIIGEEVGIVTSETDEENDMKIYKTEAVIRLKRGERHRLIGLNNWGIVAEIWQHTDEKNLSDENDIIRLQDDFGR